MTTSDFVVITGTSSGLGKALAIALATSGYSIVGIARREVAPDTLGLAPDQYHHISFDLADTNSIHELAKKIIGHAGAPFGLVNNAAIGLDGMLATMHNSEIDDLLRVNTISPIILTKYLSRSMIEVRRGRIINITSVVATTGYRGLSVYAASKSAMEGFTHSLARDLGSRNITVNCIAPGFMETAMTSGINPQAIDRIRRRSALGRMPLAKEVAACAAYLLSDNAAGITGTTITIDAGNTA